MEHTNLSRHDPSVRLRINLKNIKKHSTGMRPSTRAISEYEAISEYDDVIAKS
jgi:hypothetical protein